MALEEVLFDEEETKDLIVLKLGGSVLTDKDIPFMSNRANLDRLSKEIALGLNRDRNNLVLIHGAGSFGHPMVYKTRIHEGITRPEQLLSFAEVQRWQNHWNVLVTGALQKVGLAAIPCQASSNAVMEAGRLISMSLDAVKGFLDIGLIPVLYGVPAYDSVQGCSILSGDQIAPYIARNLKAKRLILGTDVDGVFTDDPKRNPEAKLLREITSENIEEVNDLLSEAAKASVVDVTGGMLGKVMELMDLARLGIVSEILNANRKGYVGRALAGESGLGTTVRI